MKNKHYHFTLVLLFISIKSFSQQWTTHSPYPDPQLIEISTPDPIHIKGYGDSLFYRSDDGGITWQSQHLAFRPYHIFFLDSLNGWLVSDSTTILHTIDGGNSWTSQFLSNWSGINNLQFVTPDTGFCSVLSILYSTTDGGNSWSVRSTSLNFSNSKFQFIDPRNSWLVNGYDTLIYKTNDGGYSWTSYALNIQIRISGSNKPLFFLDSLNGWITLLSDSILKTVDGGNSWQLIPAGADNGNIVFSDLNNGIITHVRSVYLTTDGGISWNLTNTFKGYYFSQFIPTTTNSIFFISCAGNVYKSGDGINWAKLADAMVLGESYGTTSQQLKFHTFKNGSYVTTPMYIPRDFAYENTISLTNDSGVTWNHITNYNFSIYNIFFQSDSFAFFTTTEDELTWYLTKTTNRFQTVQAVQASGGPGLFFSDSLHGSTYNWYTTDGGATFQLTNVIGGTGSFKEIYFINTLQGWAIDDDYLFKTTDGGVTWNNIYQSQYSQPWCKLSFVDSLNGFLAISNGSSSNTFLKTHDGGLTWDSLNISIRFSDLYFKDSLNGWFANDGYYFSQPGIFFTSDGGNTFTRQDSTKLFILSFINGEHGFAIGHNRFATSDQSGVFNSVFSQSPKPEITVSPNPAINEIVVTSPEIINSITLINSQGQQLSKNTVKSKDFNLKVKNLSSGNYILAIDIKNQTFTKNIVIVH